MIKETELPENEKIIRNTERYGDICEVNYQRIYEDKQQTLSKVLEIINITTILEQKQKDYLAGLIMELK